MPALAGRLFARIDNFVAHQTPGVREAIEAVGAHLLYSSPCLPDFNPDDLLAWFNYVGYQLANLRPV